MKKVILFLILIMFSSCNKEYKYVEIVDGNYSKKEKEPQVLSAQNDTLAYLKAFEKFCISLAVYDRMKKEYRNSTEFLSIPLDFKLLNSNGIDISKTTFFVSKDIPFINP